MSTDQRTLTPASTLGTKKMRNEQTSLDEDLRSDYCHSITTYAIVWKKRLYRLKHAFSRLLSGYSLHQGEGFTVSTTHLLSGKQSVNVLHSVEICSVQGILAGKHLRRGKEKIQSVT